MEEIAVPTGWRERLEDLAGRRRDAAAVGALVVVVASLALIAWGRNAPAHIAPAASAAATPEAPDASRAGVVHVHVAGAVAAPGLYVLEEGARVADAVDAAGGPRRRASLDQLNLAQVLADGMKVDVPRRGDPVARGSSEHPDPDATLVSINSADQQALETVPGLGPAKASAIVRYREQMGPFSALEQVMEVSGIGPATFEQIRPFISL